MDLQIAVFTEQGSFADSSVEIITVRVALVHSCRSISLIHRKSHPVAFHLQLPGYDT